MIQTTKKNRRQRRIQEQYKTALLADLAHAKRELDDASKNLNFVKDELLLDHFIFRMKSCEMKYRYLLTLAREMDIVYEKENAL